MVDPRTLTLVLTWIEQTLARHAANARPVAALDFLRLPQYFSPARLAATKVIAVEIVPLPPVTALGLKQFAELKSMHLSGITYLDTFFVREDLTGDERLHFHELVHVIQWSLLGAERFLAAYADGLEKHGYRKSPLEEMAYSLDNLFQMGAAPFDVEKVVQTELKTLNLL
jgi:hypothetical protein